MKIQVELEKREKLSQVLRELSQSQGTLEEPRTRSSFYHRLEDIYYNPDGENFRHYYSDIFSTLSIIDAEGESGVLDILAQNIGIIKNNYLTETGNMQDKVVDIGKEIIKLYDHVNLEVGRINYTKNFIDNAQSEIVNYQKKTEKMLNTINKEINDVENFANAISKKNANDIVKARDQMQEQLAGWQRESVVILGIFAAIVLAFTGGMTFSGSVLKNIDKASIYRILIITLMVGLVFFDTIWILIGFIRDIIDRDATGDRKICAKGKPTLVYVNMILILIVASACLINFFVSLK